MLEAQSIEKSFGELKVLSSINLNITPGAITVLTGPSGSGKSTLIRCLSLLDFPCKGKIIIDGMKYSFPRKDKPNESEIYPKVTCVFQQLYLWPHLTNRENILLAQNNSSYNRKEVDRYIKLFGMKEFIDKYPNESSLGQKQRISIARALILKPKYLLLDEITSALDSYNTDIVLSELLTLSNDNVGILLVTHDYEVILNKNYIPMLLENGKLTNVQSNSRRVSKIRKIIKIKK